MCNSEGVKAYYWSQFDIPNEDDDILPEFSEEKVLEVLERGIREQRTVAGPSDVKITEITASCRYPAGAGGGGGMGRGGVTPRGR